MPRPAASQEERQDIDPEQNSHLSRKDSVAGFAFCPGSTVPRLSMVADPVFLEKNFIGGL